MIVEVLLAIAGILGVVVGIIGIVAGYLTSRQLIRSQEIRAIYGERMKYIEEFYSPIFDRLGNLWGCISQLLDKGLKESVSPCFKQIDEFIEFFEKNVAKAKILFPDWYCDWLFGLAVLLGRFKELMSLKEDRRNQEFWPLVNGILVEIGKYSHSLLETISFRLKEWLGLFFAFDKEPPRVLEEQIFKDLVVESRRFTEKSG